MLLNKKSKRFLSILITVLVLIVTSCSSSGSEEYPEPSDEQTPSANAITDYISEPESEQNTEPNAELEPLPDLEAKIIITNIVSECSPGGDYCGFDIRLGSPPTDNNEVSITIQDLKQTTEVEGLSNGC